MVLEKEWAINVDENQYMNLDGNLFKKGNTQGIHSIDVLRKARSEKIQKKDLVRDCDIADVFVKFSTQCNDDKFIYSVAVALTLTLIHEQTLPLINQFEIPIKVHIDCTGKVVKSPKCCTSHTHKRILYYACVINVNDVSIPLAELIIHANIMQLQLKNF